MTAKDYLKQAYRLDHRINSDLAEINRLRKMACSITAVGLEEHFNPNHATEAPFVHCIEKIWALEKKIDAEVDLLVGLKEQMRNIIEMIPNADEQMVLRYRYIHNKTWEQIGDEMQVKSRFVCKFL
ncbi:MAG: RNA polymerase subunit sigma-70 [Oscillospiraceae bacterium]|nr:RNA polymerase subunit sigma-70 [Oscillospiraceae bacterium]